MQLTAKMTTNKQIKKIYTLKKHGCTQSICITSTKLIHSSVNDLYTTQGENSTRL